MTIFIWKKMTSYSPHRSPILYFISNNCIKKIIKKCFLSSIFLDILQSLRVKYLKTEITGMRAVEYFPIVIKKKL